MVIAGEAERGSCEGVGLVEVAGEGSREERRLETTRASGLVVLEGVAAGGLAALEGVAAGV